MSNDQVPARTRVLEVLQWHVGQHYGITAGTLAARAQLTERQVRQAVTELREDGVGVCATPETGYFLAANDHELDEYCLKFLRERAMTSLVLCSKLTKQALPDLIGQLKLPT
jgi:biotin operon repressor